MHSSRFLTKPGCSNPFTTNEKGVTPTPTLMLLKKKVGQSANGKNSVIQKNAKAFWLNTLKKDTKPVLKNTRAGNICKD